MIFGTLLPIFLFCQNLDDIKRESEIIPMLCHNQIINFKIDSSVKQFPPAETFSTINFIANGSEIATTESVVKGSWNYDIKTNNLILKIKKKVLKLKVLKLTNKEMILEKNDNNWVSKKVYFWRAD